MPDSTKTTRDKKGRWQRGVSGNPEGRPVSNPGADLLTLLAVDEVDPPRLKRYIANDTSPAYARPVQHGRVGNIRGIYT